MPLSVKDGMGAWVKDFQDSNAPQFKGKSDKERREMAIAAYLSAKRGDQNESVEEAKRTVTIDKPDRLVSMKVSKDKPPFTPDPPKPQAKNSDGSATSPMSRASQLARQARDRQKVKESVELDEANDVTRPLATTKKYSGSEHEESKSPVRLSGRDRAKHLEHEEEFRKRAEHHRNEAKKDGASLDQQIAHRKAAEANHNAARMHFHVRRQSDNSKPATAGALHQAHHAANKAIEASNHVDIRKESVELGENIIVKRAYEIMKPTKSMNHGIEALKKNMKIDHGAATRLARQVMDKVKKGEFRESVQVDELKKSTLGSYVKKAAQDAGAKAYSAAQKAMSNPDQSGKDYVKSVKRQKGIARATDKLANEAGTPERLAMIRKAGEKINKEKKKAERDAKKAMSKDKDMMGEAKSFDQKFKDHLKFATSKSPAVQAYMKKRKADRDAAHAKQDPSAVKKNYGPAVIPPGTAYNKASKRGMNPSQAASAVSTAFKNRAKGGKLPK